MSPDFFLGLFVGAGISIMALVVYGVWSDGAPSL